ncbi:MAG: sulfate/molybdate ABC transporter ATP-binding protein [Intestinimonas sp.]
MEHWDCLAPPEAGRAFTLKCIAGIERPDRGKILLNGVTLFDSERWINLPPQKRRVGYLFQNYALFPNMTVRQNILCGIRWERDRARRAAELRRVVELLHLQGLEEQRPDQLSGGQQQRTALARILVSRPELLMLDEPFSALDEHLRDQLQIQMKKLLDTFDGDILLVTHNHDEAYHMCEKAAVVDGGRILGVRETELLFLDPGSVPAARLTGCRNISSAARRVGAYEVEIPGWGIRPGHSATGERGGAGCRGAGRRFFHTCPENRFPVSFTGHMELPFETQMCFRYEGQAETEGELWWSRPGRDGKKDSRRSWACPVKMSCSFTNN